MTDFEDFYEHLENLCSVRLGVADKHSIRNLINGHAFMNQDYMVCVQNSVDLLFSTGFESSRLYYWRNFYHDANRQFGEAALRRKARKTKVSD